MSNREWSETIWGKTYYAIKVFNEPSFKGVDGWLGGGDEFRLVQSVTKALHFLSIDSAEHEIDSASGFLAKQRLIRPTIMVVKEHPQVIEWRPYGPE